MKLSKINIVLIIIVLLLVGGWLYFWYNSVYTTIDSQTAQKLGLDQTKRYTKEEINTASVKVANVESADADGDGILDFHEEKLGYNPTLKDTDGDGVHDGIQEIRKMVKEIESENGEPSLKITDLADKNNDGIPDELALKLGLLPDQPNTYEDYVHAIYLFQINLEQLQQK